MQKMDYRGMLDVHLVSCSINLAAYAASGASYIGYLLAKKLNFKYVDREILRQAAKNLGTDERWLENYDERSSSGLLSTILRGFAFGSPEAEVMFRLSLRRFMIRICSTWRAV